jgi:mono/diheme cytochrome c family protein
MSESTASQVLVALGLLGLAAAQDAGPPQEVPPAAQRRIEFAEDVRPIFEGSCWTCHDADGAKGGLVLETRESALEGGESGPAVAVGDGEHSLLVRLVAGLEPERIMPKKGPRLTAEEIGVLRAWIDQGLAWEGEGAREEGPERRARPLDPPEVPAVPGLTNPIDRLLAPYFAEHGFAPPATVDERSFARRAFLDVIGLLPAPEELEVFAADRDPLRRERLVRRLLADRERYAEHWLTFWNDALRNDYAGTGYIDDGRKQITTWLYGALSRDLPYDRFVRELVSPGPGAQGFVDGIVWRGTVSASQVPPMQAAQNVAQVFLGLNLKCASCHDSFVSPWKLDDAYALAGVFASEPLEVSRCDKPIGRFAEPAFLVPELGSIDPDVPRERRLEQLAEILTSERDGRLARTIVNRIWARLMGRGLVEPQDEMDQPPWSAELLEWLASDLVEHGWDLKHTLERILTSRAYQLPSVAVDERPASGFVFTGPGVKRMGAEAFVDAVAQLTGAWFEKAAAPLTHLEGAREAARRAVRWIWDDPQAAQSTGGGRLYLRRTIELPERPARAVAFATCDNQFRLFVNGVEIAASADWKEPLVADLAPHLVAGENVIAAEAINWPDTETGSGLEYSGPSAAGFFLYALVDGPEVDAGEGEKERDVWDFSTGKEWIASRTATPGWSEIGFDAAAWKPAEEIATADGAPWSLGPRFADFLEQHVARRERVRAALVAADRLQSVLGRPNREQVVTSRPSAATTLQALELTNGSTLDALLARGAQRWLERAADATPEELASRLWREALQREPTDEERALAAGAIGTPPAEAGLKDTLWALVLQPEFQLY